MNYRQTSLGSKDVSIHILRTVVFDYGELLAYWFILHGCSTLDRGLRPVSFHDSWQNLLRKTLVPPLVPARGALVACLTGLVTLTSNRIYDLHYSTHTRVPGSVRIHILRTVVLDYGELLAFWFILKKSFVI